MSKLHRSRLDTSLCTRRSGSSQLASDETLSRTSCTGTELHCKPTRSVDQLREMCPALTLRPQAHGPDDVRLNTVIGISAGGSEASVTSERQRLHGEGGEGHDCRSLERRRRHHKQRSCTTLCTILERTPVRRAQRNFATAITSVLPDNSSLAPLCREHPPEGKDESPTGKCTDDGRGLVKTLSGRLARKLQRCASLVNAGLAKNIQTVLDAATVDRCDFVEICCSLRSHCCALTASETKMQRHVRRCLAGFPRNDLTRLGPHLRSLLIRTSRHAAVFYRDRFFDSFRVCCSSLA